MPDNPFRHLPRVDDLTRRPELQALGLPEALLVEAARAAIADARADLATGRGTIPVEVIAHDAARRAQLASRFTLRRVLNATGVVVHTNLGRAPLPTGSLHDVLGAVNLEMDLPRGVRGSRRDHAEALLTSLTGAEAALVVNNNAAAVMLALAALASGGEVLVSRSELIEIGGSFRIPEILSASGARLVEVGTTNRTYARDFADATGPETRAILKVHPSNYRITGFTHVPTTASLAEVARRAGIPLLYDVGAAHFDQATPGLRAPAHCGGGAEEEADVRAELEAGADLVCFSGDKVLGGPQAGLVVGQRALVDRLARHPLMRALRPGKLTLGALQVVLMAYRLGRQAELPTRRMLRLPQHALRRRAEALVSALADRGVPARAVACEDTPGGGAHPDATLPGYAVELRDGGVADDLARRLREGAPPVVPTIRGDHVRLHLRTVEEADEEALVGAVVAAAAVAREPAAGPGGRA